VPSGDLTLFVLTRSWRDTPRGIEITLWGWSAEGPVRVVMTGQEAVMFGRRDIEVHCDRRRELEMTDMHGAPVDGVYFRSQRAMLDERDRLRTELLMPCESDVKPAERFLMERFVTGGCVLRGGLRRTRGGHLDVHDPAIKGAEVSPRLRVVSFDIETDGMDGPLLSIAVAARDREHVLLVGEGAPLEGVSRHRDEAALLEAFIEWIAEDDPDVLIGWNVVEFDLRRLVERARDLHVSFRLGRDGERATALEPRSNAQPWVARVPGRCVLDGITIMRAATWSFESWSLEHVSRELLGRGKLIEEEESQAAEGKIEEIRRLYAEDPAALAAYNLEDCRLVLDIFEKSRLLEFTIERQRLTGLPLDRAGGAVTAFDNLYLPRLHRHGKIAPDTGMSAPREGTPGGHVMDSVPGLYENVIVLDFKSLYPSIIRTFCIDPMGLAFPGEDPVEGFDDAAFSRTDHILPGLIETLWKARDEAKRQKNAPLSQAIKIQMNSFYGVLGTPACRFFAPRLASSITRRGHEILGRTREFIEERGYQVLYGDTDSLFVLLGEGGAPAEHAAVGEGLAADLTEWWRRNLEADHRVQSALEMEFETLYLRFFLPTLRGSSQGTKKRYAGTVQQPDGSTRMIFKGLEAVRTDWTPLARRFQRELYRRVFEGVPYEAWTREIVDGMYAGEHDEELAYRKRLRRTAESYTRAAPYHVQAAQKLGRPVRVIAYYMTTKGPEPKAALESPIDYDHYLERQLAPAADGILHYLGTDLLTLAGRQMTLF